MIAPELLSQLLLALAGALMGAFAGGAVYWTAAGRNQRLRTTLDLYAEFHSPQFNHVRIAAHAALQGRTMPAAYAAVEGEAREAISSIVHFWEKVAQLARIGALNQRLLRRFFAQYARWWGELLCDKREALADAEWGATLCDIDWLFQRLKRERRAGARR